MSTYNTLNQIRDAANTLVDSFTRVPASELGLDPRCGALFIDEDGQYLAVPRSRKRTIDYYGGFEYVDPDAVTIFGDWVLYDSNMDERVAGHVDIYHEGRL